jgi:hypothetical protein
MTTNKLFTRHSNNLNRQCLPWLTRVHQGSHPTEVKNTIHKCTTTCPITSRWWCRASCQSTARLRPILKCSLYRSLTIISTVLPHSTYNTATILKIGWSLRAWVTRPQWGGWANSPSLNRATIGRLSSWRSRGDRRGCEIINNASSMRSRSFTVDIILKWMTHLSFRSRPTGISNNKYSDKSRNRCRCKRSNLGSPCRLWRTRYRKLSMRTLRSPSSQTRAETHLIRPRLRLPKTASKCRIWVTRKKAWRK